MKLARKTDMSPKLAEIPKETYPEFSVQDEHAEQMMKDHPGLGMGHMLTGMVKLKVNHMSADRHGKRIGLEVRELNDMKHHAPAGDKSNAEEVADVQHAIENYEGGENE